MCRFAHALQKGGVTPLWAAELCPHTVNVTGNARHMRRLEIAIALVALTVGATACGTLDTAGTAVPDNPQAVVNERVAVMKSFAGAVTTSGQFIQGKATAAVATAKVASAAGGAERLARLFPRGTALGDRGVSQSRALSTIFANRSDFDAKLGNLANALANLDTALGPADKKRVATAVAEVRKACLACHSRYRTPDES